MQTQRLTGIGASALKYDVLTALAVAGHHGTLKDQHSMARLCSLLTARYNWKRDEFCVGQREMARMWNVTERTVKRQLKHWLYEQVLICIRQGVRGRVGAYKLNLMRVFDITRPTWEHVGPDFAERMNAMDQPKSNTVVPVDFSAGRSDQTPPSAAEVQLRGQGSWGTVSARLQVLYPDLHRTWFAQLRLRSEEGRAYVLRANSRFAAQYVETHLGRVLAQAVQAEVGMRRVTVVGPD